MKYIPKKKIGNLTQQKWISKLIRYDIITEYRVGKENMVVDVLCRKSKGDKEGELLAITSPIIAWVDVLKKSYHYDLGIQDIFQHMKIEILDSLRYHIKKRDVALQRKTIYIIRECPFKRDIMQYIHDSPVIGP